MKRLAGVIASFMLVASLLSGCGPNAQSSTDTPDKQDGSPAAQSGTGNKAKFTPADLSGEVSSISGNNITLKIAQTPKFRNGGKPNNNPNKDEQSKDNPSSQNNTNQDNGQNPPKQGADGQQRHGPGAGAMKFTGETKTIAVPNGTPITTFAMDGKTRETKTIDIKDVKQGDILQIWYSDKDKGAISKINVMHPRNKQEDQNSQNNQNTQTNQN